MAQRLSYAEEDIEVKPSPELIPDEYEHFRESVSAIAVHTFSESFSDENVTQFCDTLKICGIDVKEENKHSLRTDNYIGVLDRIRHDADNMDGLIMLFCGSSNVDGELLMYDGREVENVNMENIWSKFYSNNCKGLKNKPKIFIFAVSPRTPVQYDARRITYELTYDTPAEADMLTIYNKTHDYEIDFMENFCRNIEEYGKHEDIISLVTCVVSQYIRPLVISTLTRKFYFTASDVRGHHLIIQNNRAKVNDHLKEVKDILSSNITVKDKPTKGKITEFLKQSFRKKNREKNEEKNKEKNEVKKEGPGKSTITTNQDTQLNAGKSNLPAGRTPRNRLTSQTGSDGALNSGRRPSQLSEKDRKPWKP